MRGKILGSADRPVFNKLSLPAKKEGFFLFCVTRACKKALYGVKALCSEKRCGRLEDSKIVELYFARDEAAIARTRETYGDRLRALSLGITGDFGSAEECESDTYLQAWNSIPPHDPAGYLFAFLARICRHLSLDVCRRNARLKRKALVVELSEEMEQCIPAPGDTPCQVDGILLGQAISRFLRTLPAEKRTIFVRRYWYLDDISRIAQRYRLSESKVKTMLFRTRNALRIFLEQEGYAL